MRKLTNSLLLLIFTLQLSASANTFKIRNEFGEMLFVFLSDSSKTIVYQGFINAYESTGDIDLPIAAYTCDIANSSNLHYGYINFKLESNGQILGLNRFKLILDPAAVPPKVEALKANSDKPAEPTKVEPAKEVSAPANISSVIPAKAGIQADSSKTKFIKIANISSLPVHIDIFVADNQKLGAGWTIATDTYTPQFLLFENKNIEVPAEALLILSTEKGFELKKKTSELSLDEASNYSWLIDNKLLGL